MTDFILRDARPQDQDAIREVTLAANEQYGKISPAMWDEYKENIIQTLANIAPAEQMVAEKEGEILGTVLLYPAGTTFPDGQGGTHVFEFPEVRLLAVNPPARGQGIGHALMVECLERSRRAGSTALALHTTDLMQVAMQMYERMGFVRAPETDFEPAPGFTIKGYRYPLTPAQS